MKASVELEIREAMGDSPVPQSEYFCSPSSPYTDFPSQDPSIEPQDAEDKPETDEQPDEAAVDALEASTPPPEPKEDLCKVLVQAGSVEVEEIKPEVEVEVQSKVVAQRKPPEVNI
ncbi:hypothetical protein PISMIDRAFT_10216 [Pisolithus microcarpus 441]|uniref:Uncharacterized protein n=1 Tax=Pisolithus microcarpus 441 TaxID=765257 RepID=A0A0C9Z5G1_9AGAM|nr:hypothetical protein PISMIDRAFT_19193 [Pisolithus microcarpus 441]KIK24361.1 hypothetical protein PISMIDRAFT_10216 [Pisolithus microcarpus 441]